MKNKIKLWLNIFIMIMVLILISPFNCADRTCVNTVAVSKAQAGDDIFESTISTGKVLKTNTGVGTTRPSLTANVAPQHHNLGDVAISDFQKLNADGLLPNGRYIFKRDGNNVVYTTVIDGKSYFGDSLRTYSDDAIKDIMDPTAMDVTGFTGDVFDFTGTSQNALTINQPITEDLYKYFGTESNPKLFVDEANKIASDFGTTLDFSGGTATFSPDTPQLQKIIVFDKIQQRFKDMADTIPGLDGSAIDNYYAGIFKEIK